MSEQSNAVASDQYVAIERVFDAPRELVWRAWTEPQHFMQWWGPNDFETPHCTLDLRVGGQLHFCMRNEQFGDIWCGGVYQEIDPPSRLVVTDYFADEHGNKVSPATYGMANHPEESLVTLTLDDLGGGRTKMVLRHGPISDNELRGGANEGWSQSFDKLAAYLAARD